MKLEELVVYRLAMAIGEEVWNMTVNWKYNAMSTIGNQVIRSADSIAANIAEGFGRYFYKENKRFCYYARGSLIETKVFLIKAHER